MADLLVMVPTRGRRGQCERLLKSFQETAAETTDIVFIIDGDDEETYSGMDWGPASKAVLSPRYSLTGKLNRTAAEMLDDYRYLMFSGDDHVFQTMGWDTAMLDTMEAMGGSGMVYPDDKRRHDVPEIIMISSDVVRVLDYFAVPSFKHYYIDNAWAELGKRAGVIRWCPEAVIEHLHYSVCKDTERDATYTEAENAWGDSDLRAFHEWRATSLPAEVAKLRRTFNLDVQWVLERVLCVAIFMGQTTVPSSSTVPLFTIPPGPTSVTFYNVSGATVFCAVSPTIPTATALNLHTVPVTFQAFVSSKGATIFGTTGSVTAASVNYIMDTAQ